MSASGDFPFSETDLAQLRDRGIAEATAQDQMRMFRQGLKPMRLERACTLGDGILALAPETAAAHSLTYASAQDAGRAMEFIPASGAATRMFKGLIAIWNRKEHPSLAGLSALKDDADAKETLDWFQGLLRFAFFPALKDILAGAGLDAEALHAAGDYRAFLDALLGPDGLRCADRPKALIPFHRYPQGPRTALQEHLDEAASLALAVDGGCRLHFTASPDHESGIRALAETAAAGYASAGIRFRIDLSRQNPTTDTLAADQDNRPLRNPDGTLILRPGGHGALLENLSVIDGDIVFIKNIDNVATARLRPLVLAHRKALGGLLVGLQRRAFAYLDRLDAMDRMTAERKGSPAVESALISVIDEAFRFAETELCAIPPEAMRAPAAISAPAAIPGTAAEASAWTAKAEYVRKALDRPLRICAMVKNQGEPGGGPFWVRGPDGSVRPQIVESAQIDMHDPGQRAIVESATHFNPVDLVCGLRDRKGKPYRLQDFVDRDAGFITAKSKDGQVVKALELPGLWNGSMAFWNTIFVEVPVETFNPVKTVNDLLRPSHQ
ncbi:MAG: DUF4301 family protein [Fibrobacteria bacterium]